MRIESDSVLHHPRERVFATYRDALPALVAYLPNVRSMEVVERGVDGPIVRLHNVFHGASELPPAIARHLEDRVLSWEDTAVWDEEHWTCDWTIRTRALSEAVRCSGRTELVDLGEGRTRLQASGELTIDLARLRVMPAFLAGSLGRTVEAFLVRHVGANLAMMAEAIDAYLADSTKP